MKYCTECGYSLLKEQAFCISCGVKCIDGSTQQNPQPTRKMRSTRKPLKKGKKIVMGSIIALAVLLFTAHQFISEKMDPMIMVMEMDRAISNNDAHAFFEHIELEEKALINKKDFLAYIEESGWAHIERQLRNVVAGKEDNLLIKDYEGNELFTLKKDHLFAEMYPTYKIIAKPHPIKAVTNFSPTKLNVEEQSVKIEEGEEKEVFQAYPGTYEVKGEAENAFGVFEYKDEIYVNLNDESLSTISINFPDKRYTIQTDQSDATLFINGKSTGKTLSEFKELGPFPDEEEVFMYAERTDKDGEVQRTEEISQYYTNGGSLPFKFNKREYEFPDLEYEKEVEEVTIEEENFRSDEASQHVLAFRDAYENALNEVDYSYISSYLAEDSDAASELQDYLIEIEHQGFWFTFTSNEVVSTEQLDETTFLVTTNEGFTFTDYEGNETIYDRVKDYEVTTTEQGFKITIIDINETNRD
ncbi:TcaA NTF2-like domain-containing protein [Halobacillus sp. B23F22_1]|uniref:TcaA NTF2-like domain-containing protein n=1 Tax=Halobacillus sp. B23F22_1 TaxID=3459514 RepID=UPI00373EB67B